MVTLENIYKKYHRQGKLLSNKDTFWAIEDVSLKIGMSESVGFTGPNGAGKTTLMRLIAGVTSPTSGKICVRGKILPLIGIYGSLAVYLTGKENIYLLSAIFGVHRKVLQGMFASIVQYAGIEDFLDMQVIRYSSGMIVRLAFAIAVHMPFDIIVLDEVFAGGDEDFQRKMTEKIKEFKSQGKTIIITSHNLASMSRLCERVVWISKGKIINEERVNA